MKGVFNRLWTVFFIPNTDTDDTSDECKTGGLGYYLHGVYCLQHQHWVQQVINAGSFGVHCTQSAEDKHKLCMHLASVRVHHRDVNSTQPAMLHYLLVFCIHCSKTYRIFSIVAPVRIRKYSCGLRSIFFELKSLERFTSVTFQETLLHREVRLAGVLPNYFPLS